MREQAAGEAVVDVCPDCFGVWLDWFDGEISPVARHIAPLGRLEGARDTVPSGEALCPRCRAPLYGEHFAHPDGPRLLRCGECGGSFVPRSSFDELAAFDPNATPDAGRSLEGGGFFRRLVEAVRALLRP